LDEGREQSAFALVPKIVFSCGQFSEPEPKIYRQYLAGILRTAEKFSDLHRKNKYMGIFIVF
jgi:hypothetical protein